MAETGRFEGGHVRPHGLGHREYVSR
eukprot:COSAG01_NODE_74356_length_216_cov_229.786325_1_plen_25_part_01